MFNWIKSWFRKPTTQVIPQTTIQLEPKPQPFFKVEATPINHITEPPMAPAKSRFVGKPSWR